MWSYAELSQMAKAFGGPEMLVRTLTKKGIEIGIRQASPIRLRRITLNTAKIFSPLVRLIIFFPPPQNRLVSDLRRLIQLTVTSRIVLITELNRSTAAA